MTRFEILDQMADYLVPVTCAEFAKRSGHPKAHTRSFQASMATRLRRLKAYGLVRTEGFGWAWRPISRSKRRINYWFITRKGRDRLAWAKSEGKI